MYMTYMCEALQFMGQNGVKLTNSIKHINRREPFDLHFSYLIVEQARRQVKQRAKGTFIVNKMLADNALIKTNCRKERLKS